MRDMDEFNTPPSHLRPFRLNMNRRRRRRRRRNRFSPSSSSLSVFSERGNFTFDGERERDRRSVDVFCEMSRGKMRLEEREKKRKDGSAGDAPKIPLKQQAQQKHEPAGDHHADVFNPIKSCSPRTMRKQRPSILPKKRRTATQMVRVRQLERR